MTTDSEITERSQTRFPTQFGVQKKNYVSWRFMVVLLSLNLVRTKSTKLYSLAYLSCNALVRSLLFLTFIFLFFSLSTVTFRGQRHLFYTSSLHHPQTDTCTVYNIIICNRVYTYLRCDRKDGGDVDLKLEGVGRR